MKISYNWLNEIIPTGKSAEELSAMLTGCGLEVESVTPYESIKGGLRGVVVGEVLTCEKHPNADKLKITTVTIGLENPLPIVCGAPNVAAGQKVLVATVGTTLYPNNGDAIVIQKAIIRGEVSEGMLCAEDELGIGTSHDGIIVLPPHAETGKPASSVYPVYTDTLFEIGLTANRGDAASHWGVARDLRALTGLELLPVADDVNLLSDHKGKIQVELKDADGCIRYSGITMTGIQVQESPEWLKQKLNVIGLQPINNVVDITNYVLHELGQPLHAFDANVLEGNKIIVRKARHGEKITTLDKAERTLLESDCIICDETKPIAIAGVFGGINSGIQSHTHTIFIESACFSPAAVRKTAKRLGLSTDASFRFERGTDPDATIIALQRAVQLISEIAGGKVSGSMIDIYPNPIAPKQIVFSLNRFEKLIGQPIARDVMEQILNRLDINVIEKNSDSFTLLIPPYRTDVNREADVSEEILRIYGLNNIDIPMQIKSALVEKVDDANYYLRERLSNFLSDNGMLEMVNNSLSKLSYYKDEEIKNGVTILNPLSQDLGIMRMNMIYGGLESLQYNLNRKTTSLRLFEFGYTYHRKENGFIEIPHLTLFVTGTRHAESWIDKPAGSSFFTIKGLVEALLAKSSANKYKHRATQDNIFDEAYEAYDNKLVLAKYGQVDSQLCKNFDITQPVFYADIFLDAIYQYASDLRKAQPISPYPSVKRDLALVLDQAVSYQKVLDTIEHTKTNLLKHVSVFDVYQGDKVAPGKKSYALSFVLQDDDKTLTDEQIEKTMKNFLQALEKEVGATLRT